MVCSFQGFLVESKLTKLLAPLERDEQSLMKLDAIFAVRIFLTFNLSSDHLKSCVVDLRFESQLQNLEFFFQMCLCHQKIAYTMTVLWDNISTHLKDLNAINFSKQLKFHLLSEKHSESLY